MEIRASYLLVGTVVLALLAGLAAFSVWLVKADVNRAFDVYEIVFEGSVAGLQEGSPVRYRGIPVGRVGRIRIDPEDVQRVLATVELEPGTPVKEDTEAVLELQGITGIAYVELLGGTNASPPLEPAPGAERPRIPSRPSALERVFESTPELLARGVDVVEQLARLFDEETVDAFGRTLANVETFTGALARQSEGIENLVGNASGAVGEVAQVSRELTALSADLKRLAQTVEGEVSAVSSDTLTTLEDLQGAATALEAAAADLSGMIGDIRQPLDDFAGSGLYEFTQLVGETRLLIAALTRITKEFERDPAGFFLGSGTKGFEPQ
ncbi:MAG TPA: MlaD family protein [Geminicoccaceae bacterium]